MKNVENPFVYPSGDNITVQADGGIRLLDHFAGLAMQGILASLNKTADANDDYYYIQFESLAKDSYECAKAMLLERSKVQEGE